MFPAISITARAVLVAICLAAAPTAIMAQADYPSRPIKIVVPTPAGTTADLLPRIIGEKLAAMWGQPVVVENRPGAAMNLGAEAVAKAAPDGYTLLATPQSPLSINPGLYSKLPFDPDAFVPVTIMAQSPNVLLVHPKVPASNLRELIAYAKANPGKLTYASAGVGSSPHLSMALLSNLTGIELLHVPYRGLPPALTDLLGGHVDMMFYNLGNATEPIKAGRLKGLGIASKERAAHLPDVPAIAETLPGFLSVSWFGVVAPPHTPPEIAAKLSAAFAAVIRQPDVVKKFEDQFSTPVVTAPAETAAFIKEDRERWQKVIAAAGIKPDSAQ
jgi:tripartite-type tricarboxylate transporter receptor subunit TctC